MMQNLELSQKYMALESQLFDASLNKNRKLIKRLDGERLDILKQLKQNSPHGERMNRSLSVSVPDPRSLDSSHRMAQGRDPEHSPIPANNLPDLEGITPLQRKTVAASTHARMLAGYERLQENPDPDKAHRQLEVLNRHVVRAQAHNSAQRDGQKRIPVSFFEDMSQVKHRLEQFATKQPTPAAIQQTVNPVAQQANRVASQAQRDSITARDPRAVPQGSPVLADSKRIEDLLSQIVQLAREKKRLESLPKSPANAAASADIASQINEVARASSRLESLARSSGTVGTGLAFGANVARATGNPGIAATLAGAARTASAVSTVATVASEIPSLATLGGLAALAGPVGLAGLAAVGTGLAAGGAAYGGGASGRNEERRYLDLGNQLGQRSRILGDPGRPGVLDSANSLIQPIRAEGYNSSQVADYLGNAGALRVRDQAGFAVQGARVSRQFGMDLGEVGSFAGAANVAGGRMNDPQLQKVFGMFTASLEEGISRGVGGSELTTAIKAQLEFSARSAGGSMSFGAMTDMMGRLQSFQRSDKAFGGAQGVETFSKLEAAKGNASLGVRGSIIQMATAEAARTGQSIGEVYTGQSRASLKAKANAGDESAQKSLKLLDFINERQKTSPFEAQSIAMTEGLKGYGELFGKSAMRMTGGNRTYLRSFAAQMGMSEAEINKLDESGFSYFQDLASGKGAQARAVSPKGLAGSGQSGNAAGQRALKIETDVNELGMRLSRTVNNLFSPAIEVAVSAVDGFTGALINGAASISNALDPSVKGGAIEQGKAGIRGFYGSIDRALGIVRPGVDDGSGYGVQGFHSMAKGTVIPNLALRDPSFMPTVQATAKRLGVKPEDLMQIMRRESSLDHRNRNDKGSATGLIQFTERTARGMGTTTQAIAAMSPAQQMALVERYLRQMGVKPGDDLGEIYSAVHLPAVKGKPRNFLAYSSDGQGVLGSVADNRRAYRDNAGLDRNKDGKITKGEITDFVTMASPARPNTPYQFKGTPPSRPGEPWVQRSPGPLRTSNTPTPRYSAYASASSIPNFVTTAMNFRSPQGTTETTRYEVAVTVKNDGQNLTDSAVRVIAAAVATKLTPRTQAPKVMPRQQPGINRPKA